MIIAGVTEWRQKSGLLGGLLLLRDRKPKLSLLNIACRHCCTRTGVDLKRRWHPMARPPMVDYIDAPRTVGAVAIWPNCWIKSS
jgi:hypothetical protein